MAPTKKNRMTEWREKKKSKDPDDWKEHLEKDRLRKQLQRDKEKQVRDSNLNKQSEYREKERLRKRAYRLKRKQSDVTPSKSPNRLGTYKCTQTLRKAVNKVKKSLPFSPSKNKAVIKELINDSLKKGLIKTANPSLISTPKRYVPVETKEQVVNFFMKDNISRQAPGKRDKKSVKDHVTGKRSLIQKRPMLVSISEAYEIFKEEHSGHNIPKSLFYKLRPEFVLPVSETPHNVCVCKYHFQRHFGISEESVAKIKMLYSQVA